MGGVASTVISTADRVTWTPHKLAQAQLEIKEQNVRVTEDTEKESGIYHAAESKDLTYEQLCEECKGDCLVKQMKDKCAKSGDTTAMLYRPVERIEKTKKTDKDGKEKEWEYVHLGPRKEITFTQLWEKIEAFGKGLRVLGIEADARIGLYEETRWEWLVACYGLWSQSMSGVTVYANLGEEALMYAIKESELKHVVCNAKNVAHLVKACKNAKMEVPTLICIDEMDEAKEKVPEGTTIVSFNEVIKMGSDKEKADKYPVTLPEKEDSVALIMYTSGTTGNPKGVILPHASITAACFTFAERYRYFLEEDQGYVYLAFLPLAHIFEFIAENVLILRGSLVAFGSPRTLTSQSAKPHGDLEEFKPHIISAVPRVLETIKKGVESQLPAPGTLQRALFNRAVEDRITALKQGYDTPLWDRLIFNKLKDRIGGRCMSFICGGAPCSTETEQFASVVFSCGVSQGYGLTETCACITIQSLWDFSSENVGMLMRNVELKLRDVEQWKHTDEEGPRGEVLIRGPHLCRGYYKQDDKTKESFTEDGWFCTGDVGQISKDRGALKIIGRVKALAKNSHGEYIALDTLESIYVEHDLTVPNGVCVLVNGERSYIAALVTTDEKKGMKFAKENNIDGEWPKILEKDEYHEAAAKSLAALGKKRGRKPFECIKKVRVLDDQWTSDNGVLTAASKIKRSVVDEKYKDVIEELFKEDK